MDIKQYMRNRFGTGIVTRTTSHVSNKHHSSTTYGYGGYVAEEETLADWYRKLPRYPQEDDDLDDGPNNDAGYFDSINHVVVKHRYWDIKGNSYFVMSLKTTYTGAKENMVEYLLNDNFKKNRKVKDSKWMTFKQFSKLIVNE